MQTTEHGIDGLHSLTGAVLSYLQELQEQRAIVERHESSAAIHTAGKELQVYRMFDRSADTAQALRRAAERLPSWDQTPYWKQENIKWAKLTHEIEARMTKHSQQHPILTRGVAWHSRPMLIHAYKFETDPRIKVELILPTIPSPLPQLPLRSLAEALQCHEYLIPSYIAKPLAPYEGHDTNFDTLSEYLSRTMPQELYASQCFPLPRVTGYS